MLDLNYRICRDVGYLTILTRRFGWKSHLITRFSFVLHLNTDNGRQEASLFWFNTFPEGPNNILSWYWETDWQYNLSQLIWLCLFRPVLGIPLVYLDKLAWDLKLLGVALQIVPYYPVVT